MAGMDQGSTSVASDTAAALDGMVVVTMMEIIGGRVAVTGRGTITMIATSRVANGKAGK